LIKTNFYHIYNIERERERERRRGKKNEEVKEENKLICN
uniref:Uncharacterized protein n=1 Tax=Brugia timori TaxID=42155 RepID=A0A0R3QE16_9BILA